MTTLSYDNPYFVLTQPPKNWKRSEKDRWTKTGETYRTTDLRAAFRFSQDSDDKASEILDKYRIRLYPLPSEGIPDHLLDAHQRAGVRWILGRSRSYLAHAPGAGKTIQSIVAVNVAGGDALVVCPPLLMENWRREIEAWGKKPQHIFHAADLGFAPQVIGAPAWVLCPDSLLARPEILRKLFSWRWQFLIVDEASRFKESAAARTRALFGGEYAAGQFSQGLQHWAERTVLLDGSPMPNRPRELWAPAYHCAPESIQFMDEQEFGFRYCGPTMNDRGQWEFKHSSNEKELRQRLTERFMQVVNEEELSHPERVRRIFYMSRDTRNASMRRWELANARASKLEELLEAAPKNPVQFSAYLMALGLSKAPWAARYVQSRIALGEKVLVFFWHRAVGFALAEELTRKFPLVGYIDGSIPMEVRNEVFRRFQTGEISCVLGNVSAMGRGVNLQEADRVVFVEYSWSDEVNKQAEKRTSRRGSTKSRIPCDYLCCPGSLDETVLKTLFRKQKLVARLIKSERQDHE